MRQTDPAPAVNPLDQLQKICLGLASLLALACFFLELAIVFKGYKPSKPGVVEAALLLTALFATLGALTRHLPLQNVLLATGVIAFIGSAARMLCIVAALPFGPISFVGAGPKFLDLLPWSVPFLWILVILNSRGVARLILRPWRKVRAYGFWLIGITAALAVLFDIALEPFATKVRLFWVWQSTKFPYAWHGTPLINFFGWFVTALVILAFVAPALINKQVRPKQSAPDYHPLIVWLLAMVLFAIGAATQKLWPACAASGLFAIVVGVFAVRGARW